MVEHHLRYPLPRAFVRQVRCLFDLQGFLVLDQALEPVTCQALQTDICALPLPDRGDFRPLVGRTDALLSLVDHPRILPYVLALMGGAIRLVSSAVTVVPPGAGPMVWHEDGPRPWSYPDVDGRRPLILLRAAIFTRDLALPDLGQLIVVPGSHQLAFHRTDRHAALERSGLVRPLRLPAGSVVLFHNALWHSTAPHRGHEPRQLVYLAYAPIWHRLIDYAAPPPDWLERVENAPEARRPLLRQLLGAPLEGEPGAFMFPTPEQLPGLALVEPEHPASGA